MRKNTRIHYQHFLIESKINYTKNRQIIISHMSYQCMTISDMIHHVRNSYPGIPDYTIMDTIKMMIDENTIRISINVNSVGLYSHSTNPTLIQKIWIYLIHMNYSATYGDIMDAFGMTAKQDIADTVGIMVAKNIIIKNGNSIRLSTIERNNILNNHFLESNLFEK